jgi:hypothetical protein
MSRIFEPNNPWLKLHANEINSVLQDLIKDSNFFINIPESLTFNIIKASKLSRSIKDKLPSVLDNDNIIYGILPDVVLDSSISVTSSDEPNHNFYYDKNNFVLYINIHNNTLANDWIVKGQSYRQFYLKRDGKSGERLQFEYKILNWIK